MVLTKALQIFPSLFVDLGLSCSTRSFRLVYQQKHRKGNFSTFYLMDLKIFPWRIKVGSCIPSIFKRFSHMSSQHMTVRLQGYHGNHCQLKFFKTPIKKSIFYLIFPVHILLHFVTWLGNLPQGKGISLLFLQPSSFFSFTLSSLILFFCVPVYYHLFLSCSNLRLLMLLGMWLFLSRLFLSSDVTIRDTSWKRTPTYGSTSQVMA